MKVLLNIDTKSKINKNDLLVFNGKLFEPISKEILFQDTSNKIEFQNVKSSELFFAISELKEKIRLLELEIKYIKGEITEEEYLCGNK